ncbi:MAG: TolC family protein [Prevotellaceae bacterium]|jgi:outer membrane protein TolC|nr:TolC family protein [Prevotellaceae bacterium]
MTRLTVFLFFLCPPLLLTAQQSMYLDDCIMMALENNYQIKIARTDRDITEKNVSVSQYLPSVNLRGSQNQLFTNSRTEYASSPLTENNNSRSDNYSAGISLDWRLFDGLAMFATSAKQKEQLAISDQSLKQTIDNLISLVCMEYYNILLQQKRLDAARYSLSLSEERYRKAQEMYGIGLLSGLELRQAKIDLNVDSSSMVRQEETVYNAYVRLNTLMAAPLQAKDFIHDTIVLAPKIVYTTLKEDVLAKNTALLMARHSQKISEHDVQLAKAYLFPTLDFRAGYTYSQMETSQSSIIYNRNNGPNWGFTLSWNIFSGLDNINRIKRAKLGVKSKEYTYLQLENEILGDLTLLYNTYENNVLLIAFERESAEVAASNLEIAMERYTIGSLSGLEFRDYQKNYLEAVNRQWTAMYTAKVSEINLRLLSGEL